MEWGSAIIYLSDQGLDDWPFNDGSRPIHWAALRRLSDARRLIDSHDGLLLLIDGRGDEAAALAALVGLSDAVAAARMGVYVLAESHQQRFLEQAFDAGADGFVPAGGTPRAADTGLLALRFALRAVARGRQAETGRAVLLAERQQKDLPHWSWRLDDDRFDVSPALAAMLGPRPSPRPWRPEDVFDCVHPGDREAVRAAIARARRFGRDVEIRHRGRTELGQRRNIRQALHVERDLAGRVTGISATVEDLAQAEARERFLSHYDGLTGLANTGRFRHLLHQAMVRARDLDAAAGPALMVLGISRFARLNSLHGRASTDRLLQDLARRLQQVLGDTGLTAELARLGGAEFGVLVAAPVAIRDVAALAYQLLDAIAQPVRLKERETVLGARVGIAMFNFNMGDIDAESLLTQANAALAEAREGEVGSVRFYSDSFAASALRSEALAVALRRALDDNQLCLLFQPVVDIASGVMVGAEALLRWPHPELGLLTPDSFFPEAARAGLAQRLGAWVIDAALDEAARWQGPLAKLRLSINLDAEQFRDRALAERVVAALKRSGCDPTRLVLELTETVISDNLDEAATLMNTLRGHGVRMAIDDFGTGYSSLAYLKALPFDELKIDRVFVEDLPGDRRDLAMLDAIIAMAKTLNMTVVAEGVEAPEQRDILAKCGCDFYQGYLYSRPVTAEELAHLAAQK
ncbi:MAG: hypothetical protein Tsb0016_03120 [Sphingomonadales bacterium]